jgi:hypothetical protein
LFSSTLSLYSVIGLVPLDGYREEERHHDRRLRAASIDEGYDRRTAIHEASVERFARSS